MGVAVLKDRRSCLQVPKFDYLVNKQNIYHKLFYRQNLKSKQSSSEVLPVNQTKLFSFYNDW